MCILKSKSLAADLQFGATEIKTANSEVPDELRNLEKNCSRAFFPSGCPRRHVTMKIYGSALHIIFSKRDHSE